MNAEQLKETFFTLVAPDIPNEWDVDEAVKSLAGLAEEECSSALQQVRAIWPVSHSLCFDYLKTVASALDCFETGTLSEWVNSTLDQYEKQGLKAAQKYMADVEKNFLCPLRGETGTPYKKVRGRLLPFLRGLSGRPLDLAPHESVYTDTSTVFVPHEINLFADDADNDFMYKLIICYQWAFIACSSYIVTDSTGEGENPSLVLEKFIGAFGEPRLAADLYHALETVRVTGFLESELPGLMRQKAKLPPMPATVAAIPGSPEHALRTIQGTLSGSILHDPGPDSIMQLIQMHRQEARSTADSMEMTGTLYNLLHKNNGVYEGVEPLLFQGEMRLEAVRQARDQRLEKNRELFIDGLATRILSLEGNKAGQREDGQAPAAKPHKEGESGIALVMNGGKSATEMHAESTTVITIGNEQVGLDEELQRIAADIINDLGYLPQQYVSGAAGKAGQGYAAFRTSSAKEGSEAVAPIVYDEWDYRRGDFRKKWCSIHEKEIPLTTSAFYSSALEKYYGQIVRLRYQFEMMRTRERFVRRQRDGDDIDLDALIESVADARAGLAPSDRLFVRLKRDERDIAVLFLIDMSNSTQGWVNEAIKESLVLLCEALEAVGDQYGIYGFSGMRRLRSEFFHIKRLDEPYDDMVRQRISSIAPLEYTRMGPAIRHAVKLLGKADSRVKLLVTLSDGKPEDYDDYKGEYAVEDTRHALIEAKAAGIHPYCITIDRHAQEYIGHMYGSVNYVLIDDVKKLPQKLPEIYRVLTR